jgi:hypothetical protein
VQDTIEAIAEPHRREILRLVRDDELPAGAIAATLRQEAEREERKRRDDRGRRN